MLNQHLSGAKGNRGYLAKERAFYAMVNQSKSRRGAILSDQQVSLMDDIQDQMDVLQQQLSTRRGTAFLMNPMAASRLEQFANNAAVRGEIRKSQMMRTEQREQNGNFNPNAIFQMDEMMKMGIVVEEDELEDEAAAVRLGNNLGILDSINEKIGQISQSVSEAESARNSITDNKVTILSTATGKRGQYRDPQLSFIGSAGPSQMYSTTKRSSMTVRKSIYQIAAGQEQKRKRRRGGKMSMARASMFRGCEPAIALSGDVSGVSAEREATRRAKSIAYSFQHSRKSVFMGGIGR